MAVTVHINVVRTEGDIDRRLAMRAVEPSYTEFLETTEVLAAATLTQILHNLTTIEMILVDPDGDTVRLYKDGEDEYWEFDRTFFAFGCDASRVDLYSEDGATVHVLLGGS